MTTDKGMVELCARALVDGGHMGVSIAFQSPLATDSKTVAALKRIDTEKALAAARAVLECLRTPTPEMVEAIMQEQGCGYTIEGRHVPCNHQSTMGLLDPYGKPLGREKCECISSFAAAIDHALSPKQEGEGDV